MDFFSVSFVASHRWDEPLFPSLWTFPCSPFGRFNIFPVGGRTTVIKLSSGGLWILASTPLDHETKSKIDELGGNVRYIIGANAVHNLYLCGSHALLPTQLIDPIYSSGVQASLSKRQAPRSSKSFVQVTS